MNWYYNICRKTSFSWLKANFLQSKSPELLFSLHFVIVICHLSFLVGSQFTYISQGVKEQYSSHNNIILQMKIRTKGSNFRIAISRMKSKEVVIIKPKVIPENGRHIKRPSNKKKTSDKSHKTTQEPFFQLQPVQDIIAIIKFYDESWEYKADIYFQHN